MTYSTHSQPEAIVIITNSLTAHFNKLFVWGLFPECCLFFPQTLCSRCFYPFRLLGKCPDISSLLCGWRMTSRHPPSDPQQAWLFKLHSEHTETSTGISQDHYPQNEWFNVVITPNKPCFHHWRRSAYYQPVYIFADWPLSDPRFSASLAT